MTSQRPTPQPLSSRRSSSTTTIQSAANTSTSSLTLVESSPQEIFFPAPPRSDTSSSTNSTNSTASQNTVTSHAPGRRQAPPPPPSNPSQAAILRARSADHAANRQAKMSARRAELLRYKGTYTDSGRHSDDWLFGGWSFTGTVKGAWKWAHGSGERRE